MQKLNIRYDWASALGVILKLPSILRYNYNNNIFPGGIAYYTKYMSGSLVKCCLILNTVKKIERD